MIEVSSLYVGYGKTDILNDVSLRCDSGRVTTVIGPNGCGKSTLLKSIAGLLSVRQGDIKINGVQVSRLPVRERARKTAYLSQGKNIPEITVERMVLHGRFPYLSYPRRYRAEDHSAATQAMCKMGITELARVPLPQLSGGTRQRVYIAMALCQGADTLLLDEPGTYLDISHQIQLSEMCRELAAEGKTVLMVSHDIISALKYSDEIAVMLRGEMVIKGAPRDIVQSGVLPRVFGVGVQPCEVGGEIEYCYRKADE